MKKSRIILPAIALLAVSGIASVTGTVAWFTASQSTTMQVNNIAAINAAGNLTADIKAVSGIKEENNRSATEGGTTKDYITGNTVTLEYLRDCSFDAVNKKYYIAGVTDAGVTSVSQLSEAQVAERCTTYNDGESVKDVYYAARWDVDFNIDSDAFGSYELFFDPTSAKSILRSSSTEKDDIKKAFRIATYTDDELLVWNPTGESLTYCGENTEYVAKTETAAAHMAYDSYITSETAEDDDEPNMLIKNSTTVFTDADDMDDAVSSIYHLGTNLRQGTKKTVHMVAWFEGSDPACIQANASNNFETLKTFSMALSFYAVTWSNK